MEECYSRWLRVGYCHAGKLGLSHDIAEDCAAEFLEHMLEESHKPHNADAIITNVCAWEQQCARRFALNYRRDESRYEHEDLLSLAMSGENQCLLLCANKPQDPLDFTFQHEFWRQIAGFVVQFPVLQQSVFVRHHIYDESVQELAEALHKTPGAIEQALWRARLRLRLLLQQDTPVPPEP